MRHQRRRRLLYLFLLCCSFSPTIVHSWRKDNAVTNNATLTLVGSNSSSPARPDSFAHMINEALDKEFKDTNDQSNEVDRGSFNNSVAKEQVLKFLMDRRSVMTLHGQVTIRTLILQDCAVGLLFALLPILVGTSSVLEGIISITQLLVVFATCMTILSILAWTCIPWFQKLMISLSSKTNELYQLASEAFCLSVAWCSDKLGLSLELGSFAVGLMISTTDLGQHTLEQIEPVRNFFAALFLASIGMLIHAHFLWNHIDILLAAVILVIIVKTAVVAVVVKGFGYGSKTSILVVVYMLLLGTTALSLVTTPLLFKLIPAAVRLGVLFRWFSLDLSSEIILLSFVL